LRFCLCFSDLFSLTISFRLVPQKSSLKGLEVSPSGHQKINRKYVDEIAASKEFKELQFDTYDTDLLVKLVSKHGNIKISEKS